MQPHPKKRFKYEATSMEDIARYFRSLGAEAAKAEQNAKNMKMRNFHHAVLLTWNDAANILEQTTLPNDNLEIELCP